MNDFKFDGEKCQVCGGYLFEEDDIVVCPTCGAPHHRDCYKSLGHCGREADHGTQNQYKKIPTVTHNTSEESKPRINYAEDNSGENKPPVTPFSPFAAYDPYGGADKNDTIDGVKISDIAKFLLSNPARYIQKFRSFAAGQKASFNIAAFLFPEAWAFFRKNYLFGYVCVIVRLIVTVLQLPFYQIYINNQDSITDMSAMNSLLTDNYRAFLLMGIAALLAIAFRILSGVFADWFYFKHCISSIKKIKADDESDEDELFRKKGGVSVLLGIVIIFAVSYLPELIMMFV